MPFYEDSAGTNAAGSLSISYPAGTTIFGSGKTDAVLPVSMTISADITRGKLPMNGNGTILLVDTLGAGEIKGSFNLTANHVECEADLVLTDGYNVSGSVTITENGQTISVSDITGLITGNITGKVTVAPQGYTGTATINVMKGSFSINLVTPDGTAKGIMGLNGLTITYPDGKQETLVDPLTTQPAKTPSIDTSSTSIKTFPNAGDVTDTDGNVYQSVRIGNQVWTVQNLRVTKYNDGSPIEIVTDATAWNSDTTGKCCFYNNSTDTADQHKWGALYNWYAVGTGKLAPKGWHVPSDSEWTVLEKYLVLNGYNWDGTTDTSVYNKIAKSLAAETDWTAYSEAGTIGNVLRNNNSSGFSALGNGFRYYDGDFGNQSNYGLWWSTTTNGAANVWNRSLAYNRSDLYRSGICIKASGYSIRLVRNE